MVEHEARVLEMLDGSRPGTWGAWVGACLEALGSGGMVENALRPTITEKSRAALLAYRQQHPRED